MNPFEAALPTIADMIDAFSGSDLSKSFKFNLSDFDVEEVQETKPFDPFRSALPPTPMPSGEVIQTAAVQAPGIMNQGLTMTENALLSEEEKQMRLRQRGLA